MESAQMQSSCVTFDCNPAILYITAHNAAALLMGSTLSTTIHALLLKFCVLVAIFKAFLFKWSSSKCAFVFTLQFEIRLTSVDILWRHEAESERRVCPSEAAGSDALMHHPVATQTRHAGREPPPPRLIPSKITSYSHLFPINQVIL